jgi:virginiamycin B lyase
MNTTDPTLGDPNDGNRLVQRWAWFVLSSQEWNPVTGEGWDSRLFASETGEITTHGQHYASHTTSFGPLSYVDLVPAAIHVPPGGDLALPAQTIARQVEVEVENAGTSASGAFTVTLGYSGPANGSLVQSVGSVAGGLSQWASFTLTDLPAGTYELLLSVDAGHAVAETVECNNEATGVLIAPQARIYLPLMARGGGLRAGGDRQEPRALASLVADVVPARRVSEVVPGYTEYGVPTPDGFPGQIALDGQGGVWVTERDGNKLAHLDPASGLWQEYPILATSSEPWGLAVDGAGMVWFAQTAANQIGRFDPQAETFAEYPISQTPDSQPWGVAVSGDSVWFTERAGNKIGRLLIATGAITEFPLGTPGAEPAGIAASGNYVWVAQPGADKVAKLKVSTGQIEEVTRPAGSTPQDVALSPTDKPWFTAMGSDQLFLIDPSTLGLGLDIDVPTPNSEPYGIALEGNVALWFTERSAGKLGRWSGPIPPAEYDLPVAGSWPTDVAVDGNGCAWYTAPGANRIGRLCPPFRHHIYLPVIARY